MEELLNLKKGLLVMNGGEAHLDIGFDDGTHGVISVYNEQRPSHKILDELITWLEENENDTVLNKIEQLYNTK